MYDKALENAAFYQRQSARFYKLYEKYKARDMPVAAINYHVTSCEYARYARGFLTIGRFLTMESANVGNTRTID